MEETIDKLKGLFWAIAICAIISFLCSCKTRQSVIKERVVYDTVWTQKTQDRAKNDSVVYRERIVVQPHIIRVGDTTIVYSDTTIVRVAETNRYYTNNITSDKGKIIRDTVYSLSKTDNGTKVVTKTKSSWELFFVGVLAGIIVAILCKYQKKIFLFVLRCVKRGA
jgi:hypothetical protein